MKCRFVTRESGSDGQGTSRADLRELERRRAGRQAAGAKVELFNLRFQSATGQLDNNPRLRVVRNEIARVHTVMRERELGIVTVGPRMRRTRMSDTASRSHDRSPRGYRKVREGFVVSDKMDKTVVVAVEDRVQHRKYGKTIRRTKKLKAHDEENTGGVGDRVLLMETRPLLATKRWRVVEILEKAK